MDLEFKIPEEKILKAYYFLAGCIIAYCLYESLRIYITRFYEIHYKVSYLVYLEKVRMKEKAASEDAAKSEAGKE